MAFLTFSIFLIQKSKKTFTIESLTKDKHPMFLEHWNYFQHWTTFFMSTKWVDCKNMQKQFFTMFFFKSTICFKMHMDRPDKSENTFGIQYFNYLSTWPFMRHPWFPTRKASNLTFICFQLQLLNTMQCRG